jgi:hypothetical protein
MHVLCMGFLDWALVPLELLVEIQSIGNKTNNSNGLAKAHFINEIRENNWVDDPSSCAARFCDTDCQPTGVLKYPA